MSIRPRFALALAGAALLGGLASAQNAALKEGEKAPAFTFQNIHLNGDGRTSLEEFIGNVVLVDWWGYH
ncbi:MAG TPA: hypothetical protein VEI02_07960 [Planctomycetota bacterium]|nr:hypothetical protein [Planctomycetota bacterium]